MDEEIGLFLDGCDALCSKSFLKHLEIMGFLKKLLTQIVAQSHFQPNLVTA
ncbi:hypothetical protein JCM12298_02710 [Desulfothermus naphthae]